MAIIKSFVTPQGVTASYHKLLKVEISSSENSVKFVIAIFASAEARDGGFDILWHEYITIPLDRFTVDPRTAFYPVLVNYSGSYLNGGSADQSVPDDMFTLTPDLVPLVIAQIPEPVDQTEPEMFPTGPTDPTSESGAV